MCVCAHVSVCVRVHVFHPSLFLFPLQMNKFFKPALSLLLDLRLKDCKIDKRLYPLITFLSRHRNALRKYIYPECFNTIMQYLWECIIQVAVCLSVCLSAMQCVYLLHVCVCSVCTSSTYVSVCDSVSVPSPQDLEEEVVKLRTRKRPVTDRAQMLLQTLSVCSYS